MTRFAVILCVSLFLSAPFVALGQSQTVGSSGNTNNTTGQTVGSSGNTNSVGLYNPLGSGSSLEAFVLNILDLITNIIGPIVVVFMVVYVGFLYVTAQGNSSKIGAAHQAFLWTVVGALILLGAKAIALAIQATVQGLSGG